MWRPYVPVAARRARALREMNRLRKKGKDIQPVEIEGRTIARSVWGKRWCDHLESWSDYANRLPRGRTYVRNGSVCHLEVHPGRIDAIVSGSELYTVSVRIKKLKAALWKSIKARCSGQIASMLELLQGRLSRQVMSVVSDRDQGLFPKPREIDFTCTCPDWATMCKHVAAVLYGVGGRLDRHPESLFVLRGVDAEELIAAEIALPTSSAADDDTLTDDALAGIFGIDIDTEALSDAETASPPAKAPAGAREGVGRRAKAPARTRKGARPRAASATGRRTAGTGRRTTATTGRRAPQTGKVGGGSASRASEGRRARKAGTGATRRGKTPAKRKDALGTRPSATRGGKSSPAAGPGAASRPAERASASGASAGRARKAASRAGRGRKTAPAASPRKRGAAKSAGRSASNLRPTGKSVARLRQRCGLSVAEFASRLGVSPVTVYRWEATPGRLNLQARTLSALTRLHRRHVTRKKR